MAGGLMDMRDDARNPVAAVFRTQLAELVACLDGQARGDRVRHALDEVMRLQAVRVRDPEEAVGFVARLAIPPDAVGFLRDLALEQFDHHRRRIDEIRSGELDRSGFVARRARERRASGGGGS
jgi:hypothetical protein